MIRTLAFIFALSPSVALADCVVLLHGLARTDASMTLLEEVLGLKGYKVVNPDYPSTEAPIVELAAQTVPSALAQCGPGRVDFVTHSMGGILVRQAFRDGPPENLGRVVMLAPPNGGSQLVDELDDWEVFGWMMGPAGHQLGTGEDSVPLGLPPVDYPVGIIAGDRTVNPVFSALIEGADDGKVSVSETDVAGMTDKIVLPVTHTFTMNNPVVIAEVLQFLDHGRFDHDITWAQAAADLAGIECSTLPGCEEQQGEASR